MAKSLDLIEQIELPAVQCLNEQPAHGHANALTQGLREQDSVFLESDTDEQLLLSIPFRNMVKLHGLKIKATDPAKAPKTVKLFVNRESMGFSEAESEKAVQQIDLTPDMLSGDKPVTLQLVKFQNVRNLVVFVADNQDDEETTMLNNITIIGEPQHTTNMNDLKKMG